MSVFDPGENSGLWINGLVHMTNFKSYDPSSNPTDAYSFSVTFVFKKTKIKKKRPGLAH